MVELALVVSILLNLWQSNIIGEVKAERDNYEKIVKQCTVDRAKERRITITAADKREALEADMGRKLDAREQHARDVVENVRGSCLDSDSPLGRELVDGEKQITDSINGVWLRGSGKSDD